MRWAEHYVRMCIEFKLYYRLKTRFKQKLVEHSEFKFYDYCREIIIKSAVNEREVTHTHTHTCV